LRNEAIRDLRKAQQSNFAKARCERERRKQHKAEGRPDKLCQRVHKWKLRLKRRGDMSSWTMALSPNCLKKVTVENRPERRTRHVDDPLPRRRCRKCWTRLELPNDFDALWLTEEVPRSAIVPAKWVNARTFTLSSACTRDPCGG